jgi:hypothetical protein
MPQPATDKNKTGGYVKTTCEVNWYESFPQIQTSSMLPMRVGAKTQINTHILRTTRGKRTTKRRQRWEKDNQQLIDHHSQPQNSQKRQTTDAEVASNSSQQCVDRRRERERVQRDAKLGKERDALGWNQTGIGLIRVLIDSFTATPGRRGGAWPQPTPRTRSPALRHPSEQRHPDFNKTVPIDVRMLVMD